MSASLENTSTTCLFLTYTHTLGVRTGLEVCDMLVIFIHYKHIDLMYEFFLGNT